MKTRRQFAQQGFCAGILLAVDGGQFLHAQASSQPAFTGAGSLKAHAAARGLLTGAAVNMELLGRDAAYTRTVAEQYNVVVAERVMKWAALRPGPEVFDFAEADRFVAFAEAHGMQIRGHNLCWHESMPSWFAATVNPGNAEHFLTTHIATVVGRYKGKIRAWDVVNEAIEPRDGLPGGLRNTPWYKLLGPRYLEVAFRAARAADPQALLTYNDYGIETDGPGDTAKRAAVLALLQEMRRSRAPIDAIGIQSHLSAGSAGQIGKGIMAFLEQCSALGLKLGITELDVNDDALPADDATVRGRQVAAVYERYVSLLLSDAAVTDVLSWGVSSGTSWLNAKGSAAAALRPKHPERRQECLPFNDDCLPGPVFYGLRDGLDSRRQA